MMVEQLKLIGVLLVGLVLIFGIIIVGVTEFRSLLTFFVRVIFPALLFYGGCRRISRGERVSGSILLLAGAGWALAFYALRYAPLPP
jgi:hypothetical protein